MYRDPTKRTVCQHMFEHLYMIEIQHQFFYTKEHRESLPGMSGVTNSDEDTNHWLNDVIEVQRTAVQLIYLHEQGIPFKIVYAKDLLTIYQKLNQHLQNWKDILERPFASKRPPPPSDFLMISNFLHQIGYVAETIARQQHYLGADKNPLISQEKEFWNFMDSFTKRYSFADLTINKQENFTFPEQRFLEPVVDLKQAWEKSEWSKIFSDEQKARG